MMTLRGESPSLTYNSLLLALNFFFFLIFSSFVFSDMSTRPICTIKGTFHFLKVSLTAESYTSGTLCSAMNRRL